MLESSTQGLVLATSWQLLALVGIGVWLAVATCAIACAVAAGRADARDEPAARPPVADPSPESIAPYYGKRAS